MMGATSSGTTATMRTITGRWTLHDELIEYIGVRRGGGPVFGFELDAIARSSFGRKPATLTSRLSLDLEPAGFVTKSYQTTGSRGKRQKFVLYACSPEQVRSWREARKTKKAMAVVEDHGGAKSRAVAGRPG